MHLFTKLMIVISTTTLSCSSDRTPPSELNGGGPGLINTLASVVGVVVGDRDTAYSGLVIGHALPQGTSANELSDWRQKSYEFEKMAKSTPLGNSLLEAKYRITYQCAGNYKGKGAYLANITITPKSVWVAPLYKYKVVSVSNQAVNEGRKDRPIASLKFVVTHTMDGLVTAAVSDTFYIDAKSCDVKADLQKFN